MKGIILAGGSGTRLHCVAEFDPPLPAIAEEILKGMLVPRCGDYLYLTDARQHQGRQRIIDHRLVVNWHKLFTYSQSQGM